ncbi:MAG: hypothetical protein ACKV0T_13370 [Planctomycetales bacterium]
MNPTVKEEPSTLPAKSVTIGEEPIVATNYVPLAAAESQTSCVAIFDAVKSRLSEKPLKRPKRTRPIRDLTNDELIRIAAVNQPRPEWFQHDEECPF